MFAGVVPVCPYYEWMEKHPMQNQSAVETPMIQRPGQRHLRTVQQFCEENPAFTVGGLRWLLFHRETNGLSEAVVRVGRRVLIDAERFFRWVDAQNGRGEQGGQDQ
jgi:hypothetical protein